VNGPYDLLFWSATTLLAVYWIRLLVARPLGATHIFVGLVLFYHGPALIFYRDVWSAELELGLLASLANQQRTSDRVVLAMAICHLSLLLGLWSADRFAYSSRRTIQTLRALTSQERRLIRQAAAVCIIFVLCVLAVQYILLAGPQTIYAYYFSDTSDFERFMIRRTSNIDFYPYGVLIGTIIPFISFILLVETIRTGAAGLKRICIFLISVIVLAKFSQYTKAGPTLYALQLLFCVLLARRKDLFVGRNELFFFFIALAAITGIVTFVGSGVELIVVFDRLLMIPNEVLFEYFAAIPDSYPFGYGRGISLVRTIFGDAAGSAASLPTHMHVAAVTRGEYGTVVNGFFIADAWAEFGWAGIPVMGFSAALLVKWYDGRMRQIHSYAIHTAMIAFALNGCFSLATTAFTTSLLTGGMLIVPLFATWVLRRARTAAAVEANLNSHKNGNSTYV
jgi:hypothetical protein